MSTESVDRKGTRHKRDIPKKNKTRLNKTGREPFKSKPKRWERPATARVFKLLRGARSFVFDGSGLRTGGGGGGGAGAGGRVRETHEKTGNLLLTGRGGFHGERPCAAPKYAGRSNSRCYNQG